MILLSGVFYYNERAFVRLVALRAKGKHKLGVSTLLKGVQVLVEYIFSPSARGRVSADHTPLQCIATHKAGELDKALQV